MENLLALTALVQRVYGKYIFRRILPSLMIIAGLTVVTSLMASGVLMAASYILYLALQNYGFGEGSAGLIVVAMLVLATGILVLLTVRLLRRLRHAPQQLLKQSVLGHRTSDVIDAFLDGLMMEDF